MLVYIFISIVPNGESVCVYFWSILKLPDNRLVIPGLYLLEVLWGVYDYLLSAHIPIEWYTRTIKCNALLLNETAIIACFRSRWLTTSSSWVWMNWSSVAGFDSPSTSMMSTYSKSRWSHSQAYFVQNITSERTSVCLPLACLLWKTLTFASQPKSRSRRFVSGWLD
jgi:hypothetical protein